MGFAGPRDFSFDLRVKAGIDANTLAGVAPTVVKSVTSTGSGLAVYLTCSCGDVVITMNRNYDFVDLKKI